MVFETIMSSMGSIFSMGIYSIIVVSLGLVVFQYLLLKIFLELFGKNLGLLDYFKLLLSEFIDILDTTVGRIPGFGTIWDGILTFVSAMIWGTIGFAQGWELIDFTDQLDGFVPTVTISGLFYLFTKED